MGSRILVIDESYGAHFYFTQKCPFGALEGGADASITNCCGAMGGCQGGAILNVGTQSHLDKGKVENIYAMVGAGSYPSTFMIADLEGSVKAF